MGTSKRFPIIRRGFSNTIVIRTEDGNLDFLNFIETEGGVMYEDQSGFNFELKDILVEDSLGTYELQTVAKNRLSKKMCKVLGETANYYIVRGM